MTTASKNSSDLNQTQDLGSFANIANLANFPSLSSLAGLPKNQIAAQSQKPPHKKHKSAFFFFKDKRLKEYRSSTDEKLVMKNVMIKIGKEWKELDEAERAQYFKMSEEYKIKMNGPDAGKKTLDVSKFV